MTTIFYHNLQPLSYIPVKACALVALDTSTKISYWFFRLCVCDYAFGLFYWFFFFWRRFCSLQSIRPLRRTRIMHILYLLFYNVSGVSRYSWTIDERPIGMSRVFWGLFSNYDEYFIHIYFPWRNDVWLLFEIYVCIHTCIMRNPCHFISFLWLNVSWSVYH